MTGPSRVPSPRPAPGIDPLEAKLGGRSDATGLAREIASADPTKIETSLRKGDNPLSAFCKTFMGQDYQRDSTAKVSKPHTGERHSDTKHGTADVIVAPDKRSLEIPVSRKIADDIAKICAIDKSGELIPLKKATVSLGESAGQISLQSESAINSGNKVVIELKNGSRFNLEVPEPSRTLDEAQDS
jgi:hypothetical protein